MPRSIANATFEKTVKAWIVSTIEAANNIARDAAFEVADRVIERTPIDESSDADEMVARGDWNAAIDATPPDPNQGDKSGEIARAYIRELTRRWVPLEGKPFVLANHRHYMDRIEYIGWKFTGPYAPMGRTVVEWDDIVQGSARKHNGTT
jgi:hypothetical protein